MDKIFYGVLDKVSKAAKITSQTGSGKQTIVTKIIRLIWFSQKKSQKKFVCLLI
jgi:hypothetical protein